MSVLTFPARSVQDLATVLGLEHASGQLAYALCDDSREIKPGMIFIARTGQMHDAAVTIPQALSAGAVWVLSEAAFDDARVSVVADSATALIALVTAATGYSVADIAMIGITGTNGKTSVAQFIASALAASGAPHTAHIGVIGTLGAGIWSADLSAMQPTGNTTPGLLAVLKHAVAFLAQGVRYLVMEVSSHALAQNRLKGLPIRVAVFTNLSRDHLDYHGDMAAYLAAKARLFAWPGLQTAVINFDSPHAGALLEQLPPNADCWTYGLGAPDWQVADCRHITVKNLNLTVQGVQATLATSVGEAVLTPALIGHFNVANLMAALATALAIGMPLALAVPALNHVTPPPGRMQQIALPNGAVAVIDYAHTPDALDQALRALHDHRQAGAKIRCVFGCGGDRDHGKRPLMAAVAERLADALVLTSDNPRSEPAEAIIAQMLAGLAAPDAAQIELDRRTAIRAALSTAQRGDWVLIAGKGHEATQEIQGQIYPFSDVAEVRAWCAEHSQGGAA